MIISIVLFMKVSFSRKDRSISKIMRKKTEAIAEKALTNIKKRERTNMMNHTHAHAQTTNDEKKTGVKFDKQKK